MPRRKGDDIIKYQAVDEEAAVIVPKEMVEKVVPTTIALSSTQVNKIVKPEKKPPTEAQLEARRKFVEFNKARREQEAKQKEELKKKEEEEAKLKKKAEQQALLEAGTHVKVVIKPHGNTGRKRLVKSGSRVRRQPDTTEVSTEETTDLTTDLSETEDTDVEEYKQKARKARVQAKKVVRTIKKIDQVLQAPVSVAPQNPYAALLASRWK